MSRENNSKAIFISHDAAHDAPLAKAVNGLLKVGLGLTHKNIFCTSEKGEGPPIGQGFNGAIRSHLANAKVGLGSDREASML
jgi:hypothetical protein